MPANASTMPGSTAPSSATTALMVGSELFNTWSRTVRSCFRASAWTWRNARAKEAPSNRNATAKTTHATAKSAAGSGEKGCWIPCTMDTAALAMSNPNAANIGHTKASLP